MKQADEILEEMLETFRERGKIYNASYLMIGEVLEKMFPDGITLKTADDFNRWHLFMMAQCKLVRQANTGISHVDSAHDAGVYSAMLEGLLRDDDPPTNTQLEKPLARSIDAAIGRSRFSAVELWDKILFLQDSSNDDEKRLADELKEKFRRFGTLQFKADSRGAWLRLINMILFFRQGLPDEGLMIIKTHNDDSSPGFYQIVDFEHD